jgi:hypothetical protein
MRGYSWLLLGGLALLPAPLLVSPQVPAGDSLPSSSFEPAGGAGARLCRG